MQEAAASQERVFKDIPKEEIIEAARQVLILADGDDMFFSDYANGFRARRSVIGVLLSVYYDYWDLTVQTGAEGQQIGFAKVSTVDARGRSVDAAGLSVYDMFWDRVEYLLGIRRDWVSCGSPEPYPGRGGYYNNVSRLCNSDTVKDSPPPPFKQRASSTINQPDEDRSRRSALVRPDAPTARGSRR